VPGRYTGFINVAPLGVFALGFINVAPLGLFGSYLSYFGFSKSPIYSLLEYSLAGERTPNFSLAVPS